MSDEQRIRSYVYLLMLALLWMQDGITPHWWVAAVALCALWWVGVYEDAPHTETPDE